MQPNSVSIPKIRFFIVHIFVIRNAFDEEAGDNYVTLRNPSSTLSMTRFSMLRSFIVRNAFDEEAGDNYVTLRNPSSTLSMVAISDRNLQIGEN